MPRRAPPVRARRGTGFIGQRFDEDAGLLYLNARYYDPKLGLFVQPDWWEVTRAGVGTNRYGYSGGDPVNGNDPGGHVSVTDAFKLSRAAYENGKGVPGFERLNDTRLRGIGLGKAKFRDTKTGLDASLFRNIKTNEYTLAFAGTTNNTDWRRGNIPQVVGTSSQYKDAVRLARKVATAVGKIKDADLSFVGHSLGGGEAAVSAWAVHNPQFREAKTFNAAGVSIVTLARTAQTVFAKTEVDNYWVIGDPLSAANLNAFAPGAMGRQHPMHVSPGFSAATIVGYHGLDAVNDALINSGYWDNGEGR
ncbi:MAG: RHS repeat-associated core domain-containing protein [Paracoccaceae bacterium]